MNDERLIRGIKKMKEVQGEAGERFFESLSEIAPDMSRYMLEFAFGDIYFRLGLSSQEREMITISNLLTLGGVEIQLESHIKNSLNIGLAPEKIMETFIHCIPFTGFPRVLNAINVARKVFEENNIKLCK